MFDATTYHAWHGITPMADFFRDSDPEMFLVEGAGSHVTDRAGRRYLDARSSMWNVTLGYSCDPVKEAIRAQLDRLPSGTVMRYEHPSEVAVEYAEALAAALPRPLDYVRFGNTGSQMTEAAAMLSRFHRRMTGEPERAQVIAVHDSYHGTGPLATALTGEEILHEYSAPLDGHVHHVVAPPRACTVADPSGGCDGSCVRPILDRVDELGVERVTAVMLEPVLGTDILHAPTHYMNALIAGCRDRGVHVIADEVTTGAGRVGAMTMSERLDEIPDMVVLGKGLSAGYFPLAALAVAAPIYEALLRPKVRIGFPNGSTTDGHPLGMAAGLAVLGIITAAGFFDRVSETGRFLSELIVERLAGASAVRTVHGVGLMLGVELAHDDGTDWTVGEVDRLRLACRDRGLLVGYSRGLMPVLPPLTISRDECVDLVDRFGAALHDRAAAERQATSA